MRTFGEGVAAEEGFFYQLENRSAIFGDDFQPGQLSQHGEIDAAETDAREKDVDAVADRLVVERVDGVGNGFGAVGLGPSVFHFGVGFVDRHLQRRVGHGEGDEFLPVFGAGEAAGSFEALVERGRGQRREQAEDGQARGPGADLLERAFGDADGVVVHAENE